MSIYVPASYQETGGAKVFADSLIDIVRTITTKYPDKFALANSPQEVEANFAKGLISLPMGMENGAPIEDSLSNVQYFYDRGVRYITLTHSKVNQICDSSYDTTRVWNGLSPFGEAVVAEMNRGGHHGRRVAHFRQRLLRRDEHHAGPGDCLAFIMPHLCARLWSATWMTI